MKPTILIVDDEKFILDFLTIFLGDKYQIFQAQSGKKGLELLRKVHPNYTIADIVMKDMDGVNMISEARKSGYMQPVTFVTGGGAGNECAKNALAMYNTSFLQKPLNINTLYALKSTIEDAVFPKKSSQDSIAIDIGRKERSY